MAARKSPRIRDDLVPYLRKLLLTVAVVAAALIVFRWLQVFLLAFGAALIAVLLRALANPIRRRTPLDPAWSLGAAVLLLVVLIGVVGFVVGAQVSAQFDQLAGLLPKAWATAQSDLRAFGAGRWLLERVYEARADHNVAGSLGAMAGRVGRITRMSVGVVADLVLVLIAGVYFAAQPSLYRNGLLSLVPQPAQDRVALAFEEVGDSLRRWLLGTGVAMLAMGVLVAAGTTLLGLPAPIALGLLAGLAEFVPIVGAIVSAVPGLLLAGAQGQQTVLWTLLFYVAAHQFEGHVLIPLIQRRVVSVPPAMTLFAVLAFGILFGPLGVILATPLAVVVMVFVRRLYLHEEADNIGR
jgi:predicted PurR-regulated permease PerM